MLEIKNKTRVAAKLFVIGIKDFAMAHIFKCSGKISYIVKI